MNTIDPLYAAQCQTGDIPQPAPAGDGETAKPIDLDPWPTSPSSAAPLEDIRRRWREASRKSRPVDFNLYKNKSDV